MLVNGLNALLATETTRDETFSSGFSFVFRKATLRHYVERDEFIIAHRGNIAAQATNLENSLKAISSEEMKKTLLEALKSTAIDILRQLPYAYAFEITDFEMTDAGQAWVMWSLCKDNSDFKDLDDYLFLVQAMSPEDRLQLDAAVAWARELERIKNSDTPSLEKP